MLKSEMGMSNVGMSLKGRRWLDATAARVEGCRQPLENEREER